MKPSKSKISTISLMLVLTLSAILVAIPAGFTQEPGRWNTYAFLGATPNPIGVNQQVLLHVGITQFLNSADLGWEGLTVEVTAPDGSTEILGPYRTDSTGGTGGIFVPTQVGTYELQTHFPEQVIPGPLFSFLGNSIPAGTIMEESYSQVVELVVTEEPREYYPGRSMPTEYWSRPIDAQLREWSVIAGNWLEGAYRGNVVIEYNEEAPESSHILWTKPFQTGGLAGGATGDHAFECGDAYEGLYSGSIIIAGVLYYNHYKSGFPTQEVVAVNLHTGEELWAKPLLDPEGNALRLSFGQVFYWDSYNYHAAFPYLWATRGSTWHAFNTFDGNLVYSIENVPSGTNIYGPKGEIYRYNVNTGDATMRLWNSSRTVSDEGSWLGGFGGSGYSTKNGTEGIEWIIDIPEGLPGSTRAVELGDKVVGTSLSLTSISTWAFSLEAGNEGELLWNNTVSAPAEWDGSNVVLYQGPVSLEDEVFTVWVPEFRQHYGFDIETGELVWGPTEPQHYLDYLAGLGVRNQIYQGMLVSAQMGGMVYSYDVATGDLLWDYAATDPYTEILWSDNWPMRVVFFTDGKIYLAHSEHSPIDPKPRGAPFICLDAESGEEIWRIDGAFRGTDWGGNAIIGDSIIVTQDTYDQRIYAIGKGPSEISLSASPEIQTHGNSIMLTGMVTDISPGTEEYALTSRFPKGVPAVSDASMSEWMLYVYKQFKRPTDVTGVSVRLETIDPNGNYQLISEVTTDSYGMFKKMWTPEVPGEYLVMATFDGTNSYYGSFTETAIGVDPAPSPATPIEPEEPETPNEIPDETPDKIPDESDETPNFAQPTEAIISTEVAIVAAVAVAVIVGVAAFWALRKRG